MDQATKYIEITKGEEFRPYITDYSQDSKDQTDESAYFSEVYQAAGRCVADIVNATRLFSQNDCPQSSEYDRYMNNIVAFCGERGQGKTGALLSFRKILIEHRNGMNQENKRNMLSGCGACDFDSLDVIDPSMFDHDSNILQVIIARMFDKFKEECKRKNNDNSFLDQQRKVMSKFQAVFGFVNQMMKPNKAEKNQFYDDSANALMEISDAVNLRRFMHDLVKEYLAFMNHGAEMKFLVIPVDDIDVNIEYAYQMAEQLRKYLIIPNVVVVMALKIEQLSDAIVNHYSSILHKEWNRFEIKKMSERYIEKFIPNGRKIYLPDIRISAQSGENVCLLYYKDVDARKKYKSSGQTEEDKQKHLIYWSGKNAGNSTKVQNIQAGILGYIYECTKLAFTVPGFGVHPLMPETMRELTGLLAVLSHTEKLSSPEESNKELPWANLSGERKKSIENNISLFEAYFINTWVPNKLNEGNATIIRQLNQTNDFYKHRYIITKIYDIIYNLTYFSLRLPYQHEKENKPLSNTVYENDVKGFGKKTENPLLYTLGDVMDAASRLMETIYDAEINAFVQAIRTVYTITMHKLVLKSSGNMDIYAKRYAALMKRYEKKDKEEDKAGIEKEIQELRQKLDGYEPSPIFKFVGGDIFGNRIDQTLRMVGVKKVGSNYRTPMSRARFKVQWGEAIIPIGYVSSFCTMTVYDPNVIQYDQKYIGRNNQAVRNGYYNISYPLVNSLDWNIPVNRLGTPLGYETNLLTRLIDEDDFKTSGIFLITNMDYLESLLQFLILKREGAKGVAPQYEAHFRIFYENIKAFISGIPQLSLPNEESLLRAILNKDNLAPLWDLVDQYSDLIEKASTSKSDETLKRLLKELEPVVDRCKKPTLQIKIEKAMEICSQYGYDGYLDQLQRVGKQVDEIEKTIPPELRPMLNSILKDISDRLTQDLNNSETTE